MRRRRRSRRAAPPRARQRATESSTSFRWPTIIVLLGVCVSMLVLGTGDDGGSEAETVVPRGTIATVGDQDALSSTWYCVAGTIIEDGDQDHVIVLANPSSEPADVDLSVYQVRAPTPIVLDPESVDDIDAIDVEPPVAVDRGRVVVEETIDPLSVRRIRVGDLAGLSGDHAAVLVEAATGDLVVEHALIGPAGSTMTPCASASASSWHFAAGTTRSGSKEVLTVFNPFPGDAVVDVTFTTDGVARAPQIYDGLVVPSGTVLPIDITGVVTLFDTVSAEVQVRSGRVVTERTLIQGSGDAISGLSAAVGAPAPSANWIFPAVSGESAVDAIVVWNPSPDDDAAVDVQVFLDQPAENGTVEPIGLTIRPGRTEIVVFGEPAAAVTGARTVDGRSRIPEGVGYWVAVRSLNGVEVVAERTTAVVDESDFTPGVWPGIPIAATVHMVQSGDGVGELTVVNPNADRIALLEILVISDGARYTVDAVEVAALGRTGLDFELLGIPADALMVIESSEPVVVERRLDLGGGLTSSPSVPVASTTAAVDLPIS